MMGAENKAANKVTEIKGKIKKKAGQATDDADLEAKAGPRSRKVTSSRPARKPRTLSRGDELVLSSASLIVYDSGLAHRSQEITTSRP